MASYFQDKHGSYHTPGTFLIVTFLGGVISAIVLWYITQSIAGGIFGFIAYYVIKFAVKSAMNTKKNEKEAKIAQEKSVNKVEGIASYNRSVTEAFKNNGKTITPKVNNLDFHGTGKESTVTMGTFFIPKDVTKIIVPYYTSVNFLAARYKLVIRKNGQIERSTSGEEMIRMVTIDVKENDIISLELTLSDGGFKGDFGIAYIE